MFDLNPLKNPDALWQHIVMLSGAVLLGFLVGFIYGKDKIRKLRARLTKLDRDLAACRIEKYNLPDNDTQ